MRNWSAPDRREVLALTPTIPQDAIVPNSLNWLEYGCTDPISADLSRPPRFFVYGLRIHIYLLTCIFIVYTYIYTHIKIYSIYIYMYTYIHTCIHTYIHTYRGLLS